MVVVTDVLEAGVAPKFVTDVTPMDDVVVSLVFAASVYRRSARGGVNVVVVVVFTVMPATVTPVSIVPPYSVSTVPFSVK